MADISKDLVVGVFYERKDGLWAEFLHKSDGGACPLIFSNPSQSKSEGFGSDLIYGMPTYTYRLDGGLYAGGGVDSRDIKVPLVSAVKPRVKVSQSIWEL